MEILIIELEYKTDSYGDWDHWSVKYGICMNDAKSRKPTGGLTGYYDYYTIIFNPDEFCTFMKGELLVGISE